MTRAHNISIFIAILLTAAVTCASTELPDTDTLRGWVEEMKSAPRGPFTRLRWFCNDGTVLPPKAYACRDHGGGVQHGEWSDRVKLMRANGYYIANVFADIDPSTFSQDAEHIEIVKQMILEQFLIDADDGWILRKARYYRGALQTEDEVRGGNSLLLAIGKDPGWSQKRYIVLREAVRFVPRGRDDAPISEMRQVALSIAEKDKNFETLRIKIHVRPELSDAAKVRDYAKSKGMDQLTGDYEHLAQTIEAVYQPRDVGPAIDALAKQVDISAVKRQISGEARK
ncbi:MAG: hypothetical protein QNJ58_17620, partial [Desulfobacterales bacterium]|nr:hypothetical protein [Desulfobacterales bacterium]